MNLVCSIFVLCAFRAHIASAILHYRAPKPPSRTHQPSSAPVTDPAGEPLFLTPLINAGQLKEARNRSRIDPPLADIESYAAFFTVNETTKSHLYFWFVPKTTVDNTSAPVILWLQGGPGCSSLYGLFEENGPFKVTKTGVRRRDHAWTNHYHMLYVDQPVGTGFSFTENNGYVTHARDVGEHLHAALLQFFEVFSEFKEHEFYIAGESYGGKYVPAIGHKIHAVRQQPNIHHIPLKGMMIGNGYSDPENMRDYAALLHGIGSVDENERRRLEVIQDEIGYNIQSDSWESAKSSFSTLMSEVNEITGLSSIYDYTSDSVVDFGSYLEFVRENRMRRRIHVGQVEYDDVCSMRVYVLFESDFMQTARPTIEELLDHYPMLFYNGQMDIICGHSLTENFLDKLHWPGATEYAAAKKQIWGGGYYKSAANLVYAMVRNAGHMVPADQPEKALHLIDMFIEKKLQNNSTRFNE